MIRTLARAAAFAHRHPVLSASVAATGLGLGAMVARGGEAEGLEAALAISTVGAVTYAGYLARKGPRAMSFGSLLLAYPRQSAAIALASAGAIELASARGRQRLRRLEFEAAEQRARATGRPLVVVGDPDNGAYTSLVRGYHCGDIAVDLSPSGNCRTSVAHDICRGPTPGVARDSAVVYVSCVLEYVSDPRAAWRELLRMGGDPANVFLVTVAPESMAATWYPGARWTIVRSGDGAGITATPVTTGRKMLTGAAIGALLVTAT